MTATKDLLDSNSVRKRLTKHFDNNTFMIDSNTIIFAYNFTQ